MRKKTINQKLTINKRTISNMNIIHMDKVLGGGNPLPRPTINQETADCSIQNPTQTCNCGNV